jgi:hypothetical protein
MDIVELFRIIPTIFFEFLDKKDSFKMVFLNKNSHSNLYDFFCNYYVFTKLPISQQILPNIRKLDLVINENMVEFNSVISLLNLNFLELSINYGFNTLILPGDYRKLNLTVFSKGDIIVPETVRDIAVNFTNCKYKNNIYITNPMKEYNIIMNGIEYLSEKLSLKGITNVKSLKINSNYKINYDENLPQLEKLNIKMPDIKSIPKISQLKSLRLNLNNTHQMSYLLERYREEIQHSKLERFDYYIYNNLIYPDIVLPISLKTLYIQMVYGKYENIFSIGFIPWNIKKLILDFDHFNNLNNIFIINYLPPNIEKLKIINNEHVKKIIVNSCPLQLKYLKLSCDNVSITDKYMDKIYNCGILSKSINLEYLVIDKMTTEIQMNLLPKTIKKIKLEGKISYCDDFQAETELYSNSNMDLDEFEIDENYP